MGDRQNFPFVLTKKISYLKVLNASFEQILAQVDHGAF